MCEPVEAAKLTFQRFPKSLVFSCRRGLQVEWQQCRLWSAGFDDEIVSTCELALRSAEQGNGRSLPREAERKCPADAVRCPRDEDDAPSMGAGRGRVRPRRVLRAGWAKSLRSMFLGRCEQWRRRVGETRAHFDLGQLLDGLVAPHPELHEFARAREHVALE